MPEEPKNIYLDSTYQIIKFTLRYVFSNFTYKLS